MMNDFKLYTPFLHFHLLVGIFVGIELDATFAYICFALVSISYSLGRSLVLLNESICILFLKKILFEKSLDTKYECLFSIKILNIFR
jgi:hypothetical protein